MLACNPPPPPGGRTRAPIVPDFGGDVPIGSRWVTTPGVYPATQNLEVEVHNARPLDLDVDVLLRSRGLAADEATREIGLVHLGPNARSVLTIPIAELPIQSVGTQSAATVELSYGDATGTTRTLVSQPVEYEFSDATYTEARVFDRFGKPMLNESPEAYFGTASGPGGGDSALADVTTEKLVALYSAIATQSTTLAGRTWDDVNQAWVPFRGPAADLGAYSGATVVASGDLADIIEHDVLGKPPGGGGGPTANVCFRWRVGWNDEGYAAQGGLPEAIQSSNGTFPARFVRVLIDQANVPIQNATIFDGYLDQNGCAELPAALSHGAYTVWMVARMQSGTTTAVVRDHKCEDSALLSATDPSAPCHCSADDSYSFNFDGQAVTSAEYPVVYGISFYVTPLFNSSTVLTLVPSFTQPIGSVAAVYGQYLVTGNSGILPNRTYLTYANQVCPGIDTSLGPNVVRCSEACDNSPDDNAVYLSYNYLNRYSTPQDLSNPTWGSKFVVAHEMGHQIQAYLLGRNATEAGSFYYDYDSPSFGLNASNVPEDLCRCDGLNPTGNEIHCLQSSMEQGAAQIEGFAHFSAANVWNDHDGTSCEFTYYKGVRLAGTDQTAGTPPPNPVSCVTPERWTENHCVHDDRAAEWDWLGFYTSVARDPVAPIDQFDLARVYRQQCRDTTGLTYCAYQLNPTVNWSDFFSNGLTLPNAAQQVFGMTDKRLQTFQKAGAVYGVTR